LPPPGSIEITLRFRHGGTIMHAKAAEAGWTSPFPDMHAAEQEITFSRYVGVAEPDAETQLRHLSSLLAIAAAYGPEPVSDGGNLVVDGQTNPILATAQLVSIASPELREQVEKAVRRGEGVSSIKGAKFAGTCFAFRHANVFLTAAHCVCDHDANTLLVVTPKFPVRGHPVARVTLHPTADLAMLELEDDAWPAVEPFVAIAAAPPLGTEFMAFGFPEDAPAPEQPGAAPIQRLFRGYVQRGLHYQSEYKFAAAELSIPSPAGLSGGPVFLPDNHNAVFGVAAKNVYSSTYIGPWGHEHHVQYGIAVLLEPLGAWLDEVVPIRVRMPADDALASLLKPGEQ
jgi:hypothetical protein